MRSQRLFVHCLGLGTRSRFVFRLLHCSSASVYKCSRRQFLAYFRPILPNSAYFFLGLKWRRPTIRAEHVSSSAAAQFWTKSLSVRVYKNPILAQNHQRQPRLVTRRKLLIFSISSHRLSSLLKSFHSAASALLRPGKLALTSIVTKADSNSSTKLFEHLD